MKKLCIKLKKAYSHKKGFTLLETLVAIFILTLALTGPISIATMAIRSSVETRDNISAYYLAEEAIELVRNIRDTHSISVSEFGQSWPQIFESCTDVGNESRCYLDQGAFQNCVGTCPPLEFSPDGEDGVYGYVGPGGSIPSKFTREIYFVGKDDPNRTGKEYDVFVTIKWNQKGVDKEFQIVERLHRQDYGQYYKN